MKTIVYIDGYNLYYGLLRKSPYKWLDLYKLFQENVLNQSAEVVQVRYYTAPVLKQMSDDVNSQQRQRIYLEALRKMPPNKIQIRVGRMVSSTRFLRLSALIPQAPHMTHAKVVVLNEKKTDVNLAADLITGAWTRAYEQAVVCTNDTDIAGALAVIREHHPTIHLGLVAPIPSDDHRRMASDLIKHTNWAKILSPVHLKNSQLPDRIPNTSIHKPEKWHI